MTEDKFNDDPSITDEEFLLRRIPLWPKTTVFDSKLGYERPSSSNFEDMDLSVDLETIVFAEGMTYEDTLKDQPKDLNFALAKFTAGAARSKNQNILKDPIEADPEKGITENAAHSLVYGKKTGSVKSFLSKNCEWAIEPPAEN